MPLTDMLGISADFKGCEILVAAALSGDKALLTAEQSAYCYRCQAEPCECGQGHTGLHWRTAHGAQGTDATKAHRYQAKRGTFTRLFGGGPDTAADQVGCDIADMQKIFDAFDRNAPDFSWWDHCMKEWYKAGSLVWRDYQTGTNYSQDISGTHRMIYRTYSGRNIYITNGAHAAGNGAIQGTARELLVDGLLLWQHSKWGKLPVLPVHDQIIAMVPAAEADEASEVLARCMETDVLSSPDMYVFVGVDTDKPFINWPDSA